MINIVSLNDLVTELTEKISHLTLSQSETQAELRKRQLEMEDLKRELSQVKEELETLKEPRDGKWAEFGDWSECSAECGGGTQTRTRTCTDPAPVRGGADCVGEGEETRECNTEECEPYTMYIDCDDLTSLYIDGSESNVAGLGQLGQTSRLQIPASTELIAVKCYDGNGGVYNYCGIIGSVQDSQGRDIAVTDSTWKCSDTLESGWQLPGFTEGSNWRAAIDQGDSHYMLNREPYRNIPSSNKRVIWGTRGVGTVYCRKTL